MHMTAERVSYLHENEISDLMNDIKHTLRSHIEDEANIINGALALVRGGLVESYRYDASNRNVIAHINQEGFPRTQVSFDKMNTTCTCGEPRWCPHLVATVFHLYSQFNSLSEWLQEWRRMETEQMVFKISNRTPEAWNDVLSRLMNPIRTIGLNENPAVFIHKFSLIEQNAAPLSPFEWEWKPLFDVYYRLHALQAAWPYIYFHLGENASSFSYGKWYVKNWLSDQLEKIKDDVKSIASKPKLFETDPFHEQLKELIREFTLNHTGLFDERFRVYKTFWQTFFTTTAVRREEQELLQRNSSSDAAMLIAFFYVIEGQNDQLEELVQNIKREDFAQWFSLAKLAEYDENIDALEIIMHALLPFIGDYLKQDVPLAKRATFVRKIDGLLEASDFPEEKREQMFSYYGEIGVDVYADFLVERQRFKEWSALMHRYRVSYDIAEAGGLKVAISNDPAAVLPLLHLYAIRFVEERNRQSYRRAVNIFKKMKACSKKSGKQEFWNRYLDTVREKNRRLRALIEEMEKGNLYL